jgi:uncharacterized protein YfdQ (DUF2303 family)
MTDTQPIIDVALASAKPEQLTEGRWSVAIPDNGSHAIIDLTADIERGQATPNRKRESITLHTGTSLGEYVVKHDQGDGSAVLFADVEHATVVAILNAPTADTAGWSDHRARLALRFTDAWKRWTARNGKMLSQVEFAELIEEGLIDIAEPDSATLLEVATSIEAQSSANFKSATRLESGERQLRYEETIEARAGRAGELTIPSEFILALQPFEGSETYPVTARLRYRLNDGKLTLGFVLDRPNDVLSRAFDDVLTAIETATGLVALRGVPSSS